MKNTLSDHLDYLTVLAEERNITRAAARLFISQPALTAWLNRLEKDLEIKLFDRSVNPIQITEAGTYYISEMERICTMQDRLVTDLKQFNTNPNLRLRIGIGRNRGSLWLPLTLPALYRAYPDAKLHILEDRDVNMIDQTINGMLDVAVVETYVHHSALSYLQLPQEYHLFIAPRNTALLAGCDLTGNSITHPLDIDAEKLSNELFICPHFQWRINRHTQWMYATYNFHPKRTMFVNNDATAYQLAANGVGITFENAAYSTFLHPKETPAFVMPGGKPTLHSIYAIHNSNHLTPLQRAFMEILHRTMSETIYGREIEMEYI